MAHLFVETRKHLQLYARNTSKRCLIKSKKDFHLSIISDPDAMLNASHYLGAESELKKYGQETLERVCDHYGSQTGATEPLVLQDFLPLKRLLVGFENPSLRKLC